MKLLLLIILTTSLFAQDKNNQNSYSIYTNAGYYHNVIMHQVKSTDLIAQNKSNQISYTIETTTEYYNNVSIDSVYDLRVELYDKLLNTKLDIPIAEIKSLKKWGSRPNIFGTIIGTAAGAGGGAIAAFYAMMIFHGQGTTENVAPIVAFGGSVILGYKLGSNIFKREYKVIEFEGWTLDEKRNYLIKSKTKQPSGLQQFFQYLRGIRFTYELD